MEDFLVDSELDKLESVLQKAAVLDTLHYADSLEITAFLQHFDLSLLRVRHPCEWTNELAHVASFQNQRSANLMRTISSFDELQGFMEKEEADLQVMQ